MKYSIDKLANGLRVLTVSMPSADSATVTVWVRTGSRNETPKQAGISHFLEHMGFKGGQKYKTSKEVAEAVDSIGGEFNAFTSKEYTTYYIKTRVGKLETTFDVLSDMLIKPLLRQTDIDREKGVIVEEINMNEDNPRRRVWDIFENVIYSGHDLGRDVIGTKKTVTSITRPDFVTYRKNKYKVGNMLLAVAGGVKQKLVVDLSNKYFSTISKGNSPHTKKYTYKHKKPTSFLKTKKLDQAHFMLGFNSLPLGHKDRFAESLLTTILGQGMSSRLFTEVREKRGLAYAVRTFADRNTDSGYIGTYAGVALKNVNDAISVVLDQHYGIMDKYPITKAELTKAKEFMKGHLALSLEDSSSVNEFFSIRQLLLKSSETPTDVYKALDKITIDDIVKIAKRSFVPKNLNLAIIGPYTSKARFEKLLR